MLRNLVLIIAIAAVFWIIRGFIGRARISGQKQSTKSKDMVQCEHCKTFLPKDDAIVMDSKFFCGQQHLEDWKDDH